MNPEEEIENDRVAESDRREAPADESAALGLEQAEEGRPEEAPDAEPEGNSDEAPVPEPAGGKKARGRPRAEASKLKPILEALIFVSEQPISLDRMAAVLPDCSKKDLRELLNELGQEYEDRGGALEIMEVANGYQFRTRAEFAPWVGRLRQQKFTRLSRAALETLAIVAYRQPVTRAEVESIRGVDSGAVLGTLLERRLLRILGRKEVPGRPMLYGTTQDFLELFGLKNLKELPTLREIKDMVDTAEEGAGGPDDGERAGIEEGARREGREEEEDAAEQAEGAGEERSAEAGNGAAPASGEEEDSAEGEDEYEDEKEPDEGEWPEDEEPLGGEEITPLDLDEILKSTRTRLELYEEDVQAEGEAGRTESAEEDGGAEKEGEGDNPDEG